jgi:AmmeMemoRadiSam system protein A
LRRISVRKALVSLVLLLATMAVVVLDGCTAKKQGMTAAERAPRERITQKRKTPAGEHRNSLAEESSQGADIVRFEPLTEAEQGFLLKIARRTLEEFLENGKILEVGVPAEYEAHLTDRRGVFVTLYLNSHLRGCVGCHESPLPLYQTVQSMALSSGFKDLRFPPLTEAELENVRLEISAYLSGIVPIQSIQEFEVGRHGIIMKRGDCGSTFLPKVALEQGWDRETTCEHLCMKAGLPPDAWRDSSTCFFIYETQVFRE